MGGPSSWMKSAIYPRKSRSPVRELHTACPGLSHPDRRLLHGRYEGLHLPPLHSGPKPGNSRRSCPWTVSPGRSQRPRPELVGIGRIGLVPPQTIAGTASIFPVGSTAGGNSRDQDARGLGSVRWLHCGLVVLHSQPPIAASLYLAGRRRLFGTRGNACDCRSPSFSE